MTEARSRFAVVVPAFNEAASIREIVERIRRVAPDGDVVVIDDGSSDATAENARRAGARVLRHPDNKGNGAAVKTALRELPHDFVIIVDADGQHPPEMIASLASRMGEYDLIVGARTADSDAPHHRRFGNWVFCRLAGFLSERHIPDLTSGFRAINRRKALEFIHLYPNGFSFPTTSTLAFISAGYNVRFEPITAAARPAATRSHIRPLRDGFRFILMILRIATMINPLRIFVPAALAAMLAGVAWSARTLALTGQISAVGALLFGAGVNILFFGIVVDQLAAIRLKSKD